jgi:hypothetical protein
MVIGGIVVGAAIGGLYSAITGGSILKGVLYGAVGGAVIGAGGYALGFAGSSTTGSTLGSAGLGAGSPTTVGNLSATYFTETSATGGVLAGEAAKDAGSLFTSGWVSNIGAVASLGSAFLKGGMDSDNTEKTLAAQERMQDKELTAAAERTKAQNEAQLAAAEIARAASDARNKSAEKMAAEELAFGKEKFNQEFEESQWRDRTDREEKETARVRFENSVLEASEYVAGNSKVVDLVDVRRRRKLLARPIWRGGSKQQQDQAAPPAPQAQVAQTIPQPQPQPQNALEA